MGKSLRRSGLGLSLASCLGVIRSALVDGRRSRPSPHLPPTVRRIVGLLACLGLVLAGQVIVAGPASAGQVGVTVSVRGAGSVIVVEGSLEDGASGTCDWRDQRDDRVTMTCPRFRNEEAFEAWVWLRPTASSVPSGHWQFVRWERCDQTRTGTTGATECGVHSGAFDSVEKQPLAVFDDSVAPTISTLTETFSTTQEKTVFYSFFSNETGSTTQCRFDAEVSFTNCSSGVSRTFASEGAHTIEVRAIDPSGNTGAATSRTVTVVDTQYGGGPSGLGNSRNATFVYGSVVGTEFQCALDFAAFTTCGNGSQSYVGLADGQHTFRVRAVKDGWFDRVPVSQTWTIDATPPTTFMNSTNTAGTSANFVYSHDGSATGFDCRLSGALVGAWEACNTGSRSFSGLTDGDWLFEVRARDQAGNVDPSPAGHGWTVDTTAPETSVTSGPAQNSFVLSAAASLSFSSTEPGSSFTCALDGVGVACPDGSLSLTDLSRTTHSVTGVATDGRGNADATPVVRSWTVPLNNTQLNHGTGWSKKSASGTYLGTYSQATRKGATLSRNVTGARKVALVATKGVDYGKVQVFAGTQLLKTVNLAASRRQTKQLVPVTTFASPFTGKLKVVVSTSGKTVRIEGFGVAT
jgi:hypothetical protein